jgi:hypothetical protein
VRHGGKKERIIRSWNIGCHAIWRSQRHIWTLHSYHVVRRVGAYHTGQVITSLVLLLVVCRYPGSELRAILLLYEPAFIAVMRIPALGVHLHPADHSLELAGRRFGVGADSIHAEGSA